jgi:hypothetical protein
MKGLLALSDFQMQLLLAAATPLPQAARDRFLRNVASFHPINDTALVNAITFALRTLGYAEDGSKLITQTNKSPKLGDLPDQQTQEENDHVRFAS